MNKKEVMKFIKESDMYDFYDIFACCRERHNNKMIEGLN